MSDRSRIEWTDASWNPVTGCTKVSAGCAHCYAERLAQQFKTAGVAKYRRGFRPTCHMQTLKEPDRWRKPRRVFVCSMGDLFHPAVPEWFIEKVFAVMERNERHVFQVLTKRVDRLREIALSLPWPPNVWMGVSVENDGAVRRIYDLSLVPASVRFVSLEPLLEPVPSLLVARPHLQAPLDRVEWVIVGGEKGPGARPIPEEWPAKIRDACVARGIPFFFKQWGAASRMCGRDLEGQIWNAFPS